MIRIKVVDEQNIVEVCKLTANHKGGDFAAEGCKTCNALSIAEAKFLPGMHLNAIYHNQVLIGFFQYQRAEDHAEPCDHPPVHDRRTVPAQGAWERSLCLRPEGAENPGRQEGPPAVSRTCASGV